MRLVAWFQIVTGIAMLGLWTMLLSTGQVPELAAGQRDIVFHLAAELLTAAVLIAAGLAVMRHRGERGRVMSGFALGALVYTAVNSAGYYADLGEWAPVGMFAVLGVTAATLFVRTVLRPAEPWSDRVGTPVSSGPR